MASRNQQGGGGKKVLPIFNKQKVNFTPAYPLTHLCVSNKWLALAMKNKAILRIDLRNPETPQGKKMKEILYVETGIYD